MPSVLSRTFIDGQPGPLHIRFGRGSGNCECPGNQKFLDLMLFFQCFYVGKTRTEQKAVVALVKSTLEQVNMSFVERLDSGQWQGVDMKDDRVTKKIQQKLRQNHAKEYEQRKNRRRWLNVTQAKKSTKATTEPVDQIAVAPPGPTVPAAVPPAVSSAARKVAAVDATVHQGGDFRGDPALPAGEDEDSVQALFALEDEDDSGPNVDINQHSFEGPLGLALALSNVDNNGGSFQEAATLAVSNIDGKEGAFHEPLGSLCASPNVESDDDLDRFLSDTPFY